MNEVTRILSAIDGGDPHAGEQLLPLVYRELRQLAAQKLAQEQPGQTLQATALVHEADLRLVGADKSPHWNSRAHFLLATRRKPCGASSSIRPPQAVRKARRQHSPQSRRPSLLSRHA